MANLTKARALSSAGDHAPPRTKDLGSSAPATFTGALFGIGLAIVPTLTIYVFANLGAPVRVITGWAPDGADLRVGEVVLTVIVAVAVGAIVLALMQRRTPHAWRAWTITAALIAVASAVPLTRLQIDSGSKIALALMHLATGAAAITGQAITHRRAHSPR